MKGSVLKKFLCTCLVTAAAFAATTISASACTTIYVGGDLVEEGTPFVARTEDYGSDYNKLWFISESGSGSRATTTSAARNTDRSSGISPTTATVSPILRTISTMTASAPSAARRPTTTPTPSSARTKKACPSPRLRLFTATKR